MKWLTDFFEKKKNVVSTRVTPLFFTNTLTNTKELFVSMRPSLALLYSCGPTVYSSAHIGNLRSYLFSDLIARVLTGAGYRVRRVINITDVGHLTSDGDEGEDKMAIGAAREKTSPEAIAERYTKEFINDLSELNIDVDDIQFPRATDYMKEQIALATTLEEKGFAYRTKQGLVFDTTRFIGYGKLGNIDLSAQRAGARIRTDVEKRNPADFLLWRIGKPNDLQKWASPWGNGNPGWHLECSAMSRSLLGQEIDIHTGGEDHIATHHNNEIAQSEAASGRTFVHYWMHNAFLTVEGQKISKSLKNDIFLKDIIAKNISPIALRYFYLQAHYRTPLSFSWDALAGAASALERLQKIADTIATESERTEAQSEARARFLAAIRDDLATPQAIGILWDSLKSDAYAPEEKWGLLLDAEMHLGIPLTTSVHNIVAETDVPTTIKRLLADRETARNAHDFVVADRIRNDIEASGYHVEDGPHGAVLTRTTL